MKKNLFAYALMISGLCAQAQSPRMSIFEEFTGETCPPCAATNPGLNAILLSPTNANKIIAIKWQVPIPSAPSALWSLYQTNKAEIDWRWKSAASGNYGYPSQNTASSAITDGINSAPSGRIDGQHQWVFGAASDHPTYISNAVIATAQSYTSAFTITMQRDWAPDGSAVNVTVNIVATAPFTAVGPLVFRTIMVERLIQFSVQPGSNGEKKFEDVAIKSFPTLQNGVSMVSNWTIGQTQTFTLNCPIPSYCRNKREIAMVGLIQDDGNRKIAQAVRADKAPVPNDAVAVSANVGIVCGTPVQPAVTVMNSGTAAITSMTITPYIDGVAAAPFNWTGSLAPSANTTIPLSSITSPTANGSHTFSYNITAMNGADFDPSNNSAKTTFMVVNGYQGTPVSEPFAGVFPPAGWAVINTNNGTAWSKINGVGAYNLSSSCSKYDFFGNTVIGDKDEFILPPINLSGGAAPGISFDMAYAQRDGNSDDKLEVYASSDCGANWTLIFSKSGVLLKTVDPQSTLYVPDTDIANWRTEQHVLNGFNKPNVLVKFVTTNDNGNNLFIDNVNLSQSDAVGVVKNNVSSTSFDVYPNPANGFATVRVNSVKSQQVTLTVSNVLGQVVASKKLNVVSGSNNIALDVKEYATGVYNVVIDSENGSVTKKLTVTN